MCVMRADDMAFEDNGDAPNESSTDEGVLGYVSSFRMCCELPALSPVLEEISGTQRAPGNQGMICGF
jgi:hypothetical protein